MSIETRTGMHAAYIHMRKITPSHTRSHELPPVLPWPHTPSHPRSLTHPSDVSWSKMPGGSTLIALPPRTSSLGTRRGGSQPSHTPPAHARCVHQHAHACAPCTCAVHMHVCTVALSRSLDMRAPCMLVRTCTHTYTDEDIDTYTRKGWARGIEST
jgi:hypothetical protein